MCIFIYFSFLYKKNCLLGSSFNDFLQFGIVCTDNVKKGQKQLEKSLKDGFGPQNTNFIALLYQIKVAQANETKTLFFTASCVSAFTPKLRFFVLNFDAKFSIRVCLLSKRTNYCYLASTEGNTSHLHCFCVPWDIIIRRVISTE